MIEESRSAAFDPSGNETNDLDLSALWGALTRRKSWIIGTTLFAFLATLAFVTLATPRYTADSQVLIENLENYFTRPDGATANPTEPPDDAAVASQIQLLTSRDLARRAIKALDLTGVPEFNPPPSMLGRIAALIGLAGRPSALSEEDQLLQVYYDRLNVFQVEKSRVLQIEFTSQDPNLAARAANTIADLYIADQITAKRDEAKQAAASLEQEVQSLQTRLAAAEDQAESFRASSGLLMGPNNTTFSVQQIADLGTQLAVSRGAEADAQAKAKAIRDALAQGRLDDISDVANNELVRQIAVQRVALRSQLALESRTLLPQHPVIKQLQAQLADLNNQLRSAAIDVARGFENDARIAQARSESIQATLDQQKQTVGDSGADQVRMRTLDRNAKLISDQLEASMAKYQEAIERETATSTPGDARVISRAIAPELPSFPHKLPMLVFATLAGLVLSAAAAIAAELISAWPRDFEAREAEPRVPATRIGVEEGEEEEDEPESAVEALAATAGARTQEEAESLETQASEPDSDLAPHQASGLAAEAIELAKASGRGTCVLVLGVNEAARAGAAAVALGRALAGEGRAILVELRQGLLAGSSLAAAEGCVHGLGELVDGEKSFAEVIHRDDESRLHFIATGSAVAHSGEALDVAVEALGETYDFLILLAAPFDSDRLAVDLAGAADLVALVTTGRTAEAKLAEARAELTRAGAGEISVFASTAPQAREQRVSAA